MNSSSDVYKRQVLAVVDGSVPLTGEDQTALERARQAPRAVLVVNKCDKAQTPHIPEGFAYTVQISAKQGQGLEQLRETLLACAGLELSLIHISSARCRVVCRLSSL